MSCGGGISRKRMMDDSERAAPKLQFKCYSEAQMILELLRFGAIESF